jgi:hypothetical protein
MSLDVNTRCIHVWVAKCQLPAVSVPEAPSLQQTPNTIPNALPRFMDRRRCRETGRSGSCGHACQRDGVRSRMAPSIKVAGGGAVAPAGRCALINTSHR